MPRPIAAKRKRPSPVGRSAHPACRVGTRVGACGGQKRVELFLACGVSAPVPTASNPCKTRRELRSCGGNRVRCTSLHKYAYDGGDCSAVVNVYPSCWRSIRRARHIQCSNYQLHRLDQSAIYDVPKGRRSISFVRISYRRCSSTCERKSQRLVQSQGFSANPLSIRRAFDARVYSR